MAPLSPEVAAGRAKFRALFQTWWEAYLRLEQVEAAWDDEVDGPRSWTDAHEAAERAHRNLYYLYIDRVYASGNLDDGRFQIPAGKLLHDKLYSDGTLQVLGISEEQARVFTTPDQVFDWHRFGFERYGRVDIA